MGRTEQQIETTIGEYRRLKAEAESKILEVLHQFAEATGAGIEGVAVGRLLNGCGVSIASRVEIEARL